jgi:CRISP-associated protein Cas1
VSEHRILLVENPSRLTLNLKRLRIQRENQPDAFVLPQDIAVLVLHHPAIMISGQALEALAAGGAMVLLTDARHQPSGLLLPWSAGVMTGVRLRQQIELDRSERARTLWARLVAARIGTQATNLRAFKRPGALRLERLAARVEPGDRANLEAQAARLYWANLLPAGKHRKKHGATDPLNVRLNFGYAVLRSLLAREIAAAGLNPALGVGHRSLENPFNLADDLMEPYRFVVERRVMTMDMHDSFEPEDRVAIAGLIAETITLPLGCYRLPAAVTETVASLCRCLSGDEARLTLPVYPCRSMAGG